jgi:hypothetical protein
MDWVIERPAEVRRVLCSRSLPMPPQQPFGVVSVHHTTFDRAEQPPAEQVSLSAFAYGANEADAKFIAEAIAAEWPAFCQYITDRVAAAKAKEAENG